MKANRKVAARMRAHVVKAFRRLARGVADKAAYARSVAFYRSGGAQKSGSEP
jgi:hypothetical protein